MGEMTIALMVVRMFLIAGMTLIVLFAGEPGLLDVIIGLLKDLGK